MRRWGWEYRFSNSGTGGRIDGVEGDVVRGWLGVRDEVRLDKVEQVVHGIVGEHSCDFRPVIVPILKRWGERKKGVRGRKERRGEVKGTQ